MTPLPKTTASIRDIVIPPEYSSVRFGLELPANATRQERELYEGLSGLEGISRAGGGTYPVLDMSIDRARFEILLGLIQSQPRLVKSVVFRGEAKKIDSVPEHVAAMFSGTEYDVVDSYFLQGSTSLIREMF